MADQMHISGASPQFSSEDVYAAKARTFAGWWLDWWLCCTGSLTSEGAFVCTLQLPSTNHLALARKGDLVVQSCYQGVWGFQLSLISQTHCWRLPSLLLLFIPSSPILTLPDPPQVTCLISQTMQMQLGQLSLEISSWYERWGWEFLLVTLSKCCCF